MHNRKYSRAASPGQHRTPKKKKKTAEWSTSSSPHHRVCVWRLCVLTLIVVVVIVGIVVAPFPGSLPNCRNNVAPRVSQPGQGKERGSGKGCAKGSHPFSSALLIFLPTQRWARSQQVLCFARALPFTLCLSLSELPVDGFRSCPFATLLPHTTTG